MCIHEGCSTYSRVYMWVFYEQLHASILMIEILMLGRFWVGCECCWVFLGAYSAYLLLLYWPGTSFSLLLSKSCSCHLSPFCFIISELDFLFSVSCLDCVWYLLQGLGVYRVCLLYFHNIYDQHTKIFLFLACFCILHLHWNVTCIRFSYMK